MTTEYLEQCSQSLEDLPVELQRNFTLMKNLDTRAQGLTKEIDQLADAYLKNVNKESAEKKKEQLQHIRSLFKKTRDYGDDKVQLAIQTYELVDKHIRRVDYDLARFESEIQNKALSSRKAQKGRKKINEAEKRKTVSSKDETTNAKKAPGKDASVALVPAGTVSGAQSEVAALDRSYLDMPVDPNEPIYCFCKQVSFGQMIGCDNPDCPIEWFHFACVGLTTNPKGKWFCPKCPRDQKTK